MQPATSTFRYPFQFKLEQDRYLPGFELCYTTYGRLNEDRSNVVWICHALTGNSNPTTWWSGLVGEGKLYNPEQHFIICANILGSCYGSTSPLSINPETGKAFFHDFPLITVRDVVASMELLREHLEIGKISVCIGGSLGGQQALEWAIERPDIIDSLVLIASNAIHSPWGIAFNESQRMAIEADSSWIESHPQAGIRGLKAARSIAMLTYRHYDTYNFSQARDNFDQIDDFRASGYQQYQGQKFIERFNAFSYWTLTKMMDSHNVGRNRNGLVNALRTVNMPTLVIGIASDLLFPVREQHFLQTHIPDAVYQEIDSLYGHDGFLVDAAPLTRIIGSWSETLAANSQ